MSRLPKHIAGKPDDDGLVAETMKVYHNKGGIRRRKVQVAITPAGAPSGSESVVGRGSENNTTPPASQTESARSTPAPHAIREMPSFEGFEMVDLSAKKRWKVSASLSFRSCPDENYVVESILLYARILGGSVGVFGNAALYRSPTGKQDVRLW